MDGYEVAERLGLDAFFHCIGDDGGAYFLDDGRVLKVTASKVDACVASALTEADRPGGIPRVDLLHRFVTMVEVPGHPDQPLTTYAIVREAMDDLDCQGDPNWRTALFYLNDGWRHDDAEWIARASEIWPGPELEALKTNLAWYRDVLGVKLADVRPSNVGVTHAGGIGMRDLGRGTVLEDMLARLASIEEIPEPHMPRPM